MKTNRFVIGKSYGTESGLYVASGMTFNLPHRPADLAATTKTLVKEGHSEYAIACYWHWMAANNLLQAAYTYGLSGRTASQKATKVYQAEVCTTENLLMSGAMISDLA
jgi:hypothetical protein